MSSPGPHEQAAPMRPSGRPGRLLGAAVTRAACLLLLFGGGPAAAQPCTELKPGRTALGGHIELAPETGVPHAVISEAIALWSSCKNYRVGFPSLSVGRSPGRRLEVVLRETGEDGRCGAFHGSTITLFAFTHTAGGTIRRCVSLGRNLAHEIGHALGLLDADDRTACQRHIMAPLRPGRASGRSVQRQECQLVGQRWVTLHEHSRLDSLDPFVLALVPDPEPR